ncbi:MAG: hypothetical protein WAW62_03870 [Candidatus Saccharimonas aalborgensis]
MKSRISEQGSAIVIVAVLVLLLIVGALGYYFWKNSSSKVNTPAAVSTSQKDTTAPVQQDKTKTSSTKVFSDAYMEFTYPTDVELNDVKYEGMVDRVAMVRRGNETNPFDVSVSVYQKEYFEPNGGTPATFKKYTIANWYALQGTEVAAGTGAVSVGSATQPYSYKLVRARSGMNSANIYVQRGDTLYMITVAESSGAMLKGASEAGVSYEFTPEVASLLGSLVLK